jgi:hypothetical protein
LEREETHTDFLTPNEMRAASAARKALFPALFPPFYSSICLTLNNLPRQLTLLSVAMGSGYILLRARTQHRCAQVDDEIQANSAPVE